MFSLLESKAEISKAQHKLEATLKREFPRTAVKNIGYPGGTTFDAKVFTNGHHWYWPADYNKHNAPNPRRLNWFGLFKEEGILHISVEVNTTYEGRNDQVAGFFARESRSGAIYLLHSGRVGGGRDGVGKAALLAWSGLRPIDCVDLSGGVRSGVLVMPIEGLAASRSATRYIDTVARFKLAVRAGELDSPEFQREQKELSDFYSEARGRRTGRRSSEIDYLSRHGDVIDALHEWRRSSPMPKGARIVKNVLIDMGVAVGRRLVEVFEVKTSAGRSDVYSAIGQLMVHGAAASCRRVMVLPDKEAVTDDLKNALERLGIELLRFKLDEEKASIVEVL